MSPDLPYRPDIDGLRAIAVLAVIAFHAHPPLMPGGFVGVDVFFVISGFLISSLIFRGLGRGEFSIKDFYARRIRRIFPALALVLAAVWACGWLTLLPDAFRELGRNIAGGAGFVSNIVLWRESGYFDRTAEHKPLLHLWSLGVEEQFYLLWPGLMVLCTPRVRVAAVVILVTAASFLLNVLAVHGHPSAVFYWPITRLWELSLGSLLALIMLPSSLDDATGATSRLVSWYRNRSPHMRNGESAVGLVLIAAALVTVNSLRAFPGWWALLPTVGTALIISAGPEAWINRRILSRRALVWVGLISYPLYLWHWPLLSYLRIMSAGPPSAIWIAGAVLLAFALAWTTFRVFELPIRAIAVSQLRLVAIPLAAALGAIALAGLATDVMGGAPGRFAAALQPITGFKYEYGPDYREGRCFLMPGQNTDAFGADCLDPAASRAEPLLVVWGDSHAAHLYPGLHRLQRELGFQIAQFTASGCPPIVGLATPDRPQCSDINAFTLAQLQRLKPDTVVLSAWWISYDDLSLLSRTIERLRAIGVHRIVLVGPVPTWVHTLPEVLVAAFEQDPRHRVPIRTSVGLLASAQELDRQLRAVAETLAIVYVSVVDIMCDRDGCLARLGEGQRELTAWDTCHLTAGGSEFVIRAAAPLLFDESVIVAANGPR